MQTINQTTLKELVAAGAVRSVQAIGIQGGWTLLVRFGMTEKALAAQRGELRRWSKLETLIRFLRGMGIAQFDVNAANYSEITRLRRKPPIHSKVLKGGV